MATFASILSSSLPRPLFLSSFNHHRYYNPLPFSLSFPPPPSLRATVTANPRKIRTINLASSNSDSSFNEFSSNRTSRFTDKVSLHILAFLSANRIEMDGIGIFCICNFSVLFKICVVGNLQNC